MQLPLLLDRVGGESLTDQIAGQLRQAIASAELPRGARLPSSRRLAEQLEVARNTVIRAYETLMIEGLVESRPASGLFVASRAEARRPRAPSTARRARPAASGRCRYLRVPAVRSSRRVPRRGRLSHDFTPGRAHPALFPLKTWRRLLLKQLARGGAAALTEEAIRPACPRCAPRSPPISRRPAASSPIPARILITSGVQEGIGLAARLFLHRGTHRGDRGSRSAERGSPSRRPAPKSSASASTPTGSFPTACRSAPTALLYLTPSHQFPTGHVLSPSDATRSRPGRGAAAATFSRTIPTASSATRARRSRRSRRPRRTARFISAPSRAPWARA